MKTKFLFASLILMGASLVTNAQGYKDGIEYYKVDRLDNAKELLERNLSDARTDKAEAFYYLGQIALHQGKVSEAAANFEKGIAANANNPYNYVGQAAIALRNGGDAKALLEKARKLVKKDPKLEVEIARAYYDANPTTYAKDIDKCIKNARKWSPEDPDSYIFEADTKADKQDWGNAAGIYELAFGQDPNNIEAYVKYANTYFNVVPSIAIQRLEELQAKVPNSALVQRELAEKYYADNLGTKAAEQYGKYIKNPNHFAQDEVRYVQLLFFGDKFEESYDLATQLINRLTPGDENIYYMKRMQLYNLVQLKKWPEAVEAGKSFFDTMIPKGSARESRDYTDYGQALLEVGNGAEAISAFEAALKLNPNNFDLIRYMGDSYAETEDYVNAAAYYQRLYDSGNCKANDIFYLSRYYYGIASNKELDEAVKADALNKSQQYLDEVDKMVPGNVQIVNQKARLAMFREGDANTGAAVEPYRELISILDAKEDKSGYQNYYRSAYSYLAGYYFNRGDKATAKSYYQKWLDIEPENDALRKYINSL